MNLLQKTFIAIACAGLIACGGGSQEPSTCQYQVSFYGDSITVNRTAELANGAFTTADFAKWGQTSNTPINPNDCSQVAVIRYGVADAIVGLTPEQTVRNIANLKEQLEQQGKKVLVVGLSSTESGFEIPTAMAVKQIVDLEVSSTPATTDGIHPTEEEHKRMQTLIRENVVKLLETGANPAP